MHSRGFTLVEMLAVLTISAVLVALALPTFTSMIRSSRISGASNDLLASIDLARSEAIRRNANVVMCRSVNAEAPVPACSSAAANGFNGDDWASGWFTFVKAAANNNPNNLYVFEVGDEVLMRRRLQLAVAADRLTVVSNLGNPEGLAYASNGLRTGPQLGTFMVDDRDTQVQTASNQARCVDVNFTGRPRVARVTNNACPAG